jgi:hypothetical protein
LLQRCQLLRTLPLLFQVLALQLLLLPLLQGRQGLLAACRGCAHIPRRLHGGQC